ncbi:PEP-CTERM sorting domain-containing protein [Methylobacillus arboreus]|uniref:PEP-CTERM sorting domain-containing protein n=1 Tax=Methylobacillus arboreus TaxID=755170 RepID=UPI001E5247F7|nr:PEP-CTERM sorting domain-containing protein [Methylobacillus arboreus]MCB5190390.1 PEP-CTERM sorting domain-containing protein [Methylobacillus arboreus]
MKISSLSFIVAMLLSTGPAMAASTTIISNQVDITYDRDAFLLEVESPYFGWETLDNSIASVSGIANGVEISFNGYLYASADGSRNWGYEIYNGNFSLPLSFTAHSGQLIESYSITYSGTYDASNGSLGAAGVSVGGSGASFYGNDGYGSSFSATGIIPGAILPTIAGSFEAWADYTWTSVYIGQEWVVTGGYYEPGPCDEYGICEPDQWIEEGYWEDVYMDQGVIGTASINLQSIQIVANIAAVPEADTYAMLLAGLGILGMIARRRSTTKA